MHGLLPASDVVGPLERGRWDAAGVWTKVMTIDTDKIVDVAHAIYAHCCRCEKTECGYCLYRQVLDACGMKVPEHPMTCPF